MLAPGGVLAIVHREQLPAAWQDGVRALIAEFSTVRDFEAFDLVEQLAGRGPYEPRGRWRSAPEAHRQPVDDCVESFHSRSSFPRDVM